MTKNKSHDYYTVIDPETGVMKVKDKTAELEALHTPAIRVSNEQIEAWKKVPKEQALKELLELYHAEGFDVNEARFKLECLKEIIALQGATAPVSQAANIIEIHISSPQIPDRRVIDISAKKIEETKKN